MNEKYKNILLAILVVGLAGYFYYTYYLEGEISAIKETRKDIAKMESQISELKSKQNTIDGEILAAKNEGAKLNLKFPDAYDKKAMILHFYNLIKNSGVSADKISFSDIEKPGGEYRTASVNFRVTGDNPTIMSLIKKIENDEMKFVIKQASVNQNETGLNILNLTIEFYTLR